MSLLKTCVENINTRNTSFFGSIVEFFVGKAEPSEKDREEAYAKLYECIEVGYLAIRTGCDRVIVDYISEIEEEARKSNNPYLKKLYKNFLTLLYYYNDLPKSMYIARFCRYISRTITWSPAWEGILTGPDYRTDIGEWSKNKFEEVEKAERHEESIRLAESEARNRASEQSREQAVQRVRQLEQELEQKNLEKKAVRICARKLAELDEELQGAIGEEGEDKIIKSAISCTRGSPYQVIDAIIKEIKINREQIIKEGIVSAEIIEIGIRSFSNRSTLLSDVNVSQGASAGIGKGSGAGV